MRAPARVRVGVLGASGASGAELIGLLAGHPACELRFATSREHAGRSLRTVDPGAEDVPLVHPDDADPAATDVVFACLPHGASAPVVERCRARGARVIDLSGDLRLRTPQAHADAYGTPRSQSLLEQTVYGLTEIARPELRDATIVSNPGCYPTATALALAPLARRGLLPSEVVVHAVSGVSGAGRTPSRTTHFCSAVDDVRPYKLGHMHRHVAEIEQTLDDLVRGHAEPNGRKTRVLLNPHLVPIERGMLVTIAIPLTEVTAAEAHELFVEDYRDAPFVEVLPLGEPARIRHVARRHRAMIGLVGAPQREHNVVITSAIDNLVKGAAGQAVQNMNLMFGLPEHYGLGGEPRMTAQRTARA